MSLLVALTISISILGGLWTYVTLSGLFPVQVWASFVAWACFFHSGGKAAGFKSSIICNAYGAIVGWVALTIWVRAGLEGRASTALVSILVLAGIAAMVLAAHAPLLSSIPGSVYGFATVVGVTLATQAVPKLTDFGAGLGNPLVGTVLAMALGAVLGFISEMWAGAMAKA